MAKQRVWLEADEWACCGTPFEVGDRVTFRTDPRSEELARLLGPALAPTVDRQESHHQEGGRDELTGTVVALSAVVLDSVERRIPREATAPASPPRLPETPAEGFVVMRASPSPHTNVREWVPGSARLSTIPRVPWPPRESEPIFDGRAALDGLAGYVVDIEAH